MEIQAPEMVAPAGQEALYVLPRESFRELYWSGLVPDMVSVINSCSSVGVATHCWLLMSQKSTLHPNVQLNSLAYRDAGPDIIIATHSKIME